VFCYLFSFLVWFFITLLFSLFYLYFLAHLILSLVYLTCLRLKDLVVIVMFRFKISLNYLLTPTCLLIEISCCIALYHRVVDTQELLTPSTCLQS
jgi:hypothetical protein